MFIQIIPNHGPTILLSRFLFDLYKGKSFVENRRFLFK